SPHGLGRSRPFELARALSAPHSPSRVASRRDARRQRNTTRSFAPQGFPQGSKAQHRGGAAVSLRCLGSTARPPPAPRPGGPHSTYRDPSPPPPYHHDTIHRPLGSMRPFSRPVRSPTWSQCSPLISSRRRAL